MENLVKSDAQYQVHYLYSRAHIPFHFGVHIWMIVVSPKGTHRYEILHKKNRNQSLGYIHIDTYPLLRGLRKCLCIKHFWKSKFLALVEGDSESSAQRMVSLIENSIKDYP